MTWIPVPLHQNTPRSLDTLPPICEQSWNVEQNFLEKSLLKVKFRTALSLYPTPKVWLVNAKTLILIDVEYTLIFYTSCYICCTILCSNNNYILQNKELPFIEALPHRYRPFWTIWACLNAVYFRGGLTCTIGLTSNLIASTLTFHKSLSSVWYNSLTNLYTYTDLNQGLKMVFKTWFCFALHRQGLALGWPVSIKSLVNPSTC